ncbi:MAG: hypothetical protein ACI3XM_00645 [Eubacteriales bacterium]
MKTISPKQILGYTAFSVIAGIVLAVVRIIVSLSSLESGIEMYVRNTVADDILHIAIFVCCLIVFSCFLLPLRENPAADDMKHASPFTVFTSTLCGFMLAAYDLVFIYDAAQNNWAILGPLLGKQSTGNVTTASAVFMLFMMILTIPAAIYFFKSASVGAAEKSSFPVFATFAAVWFILFTLHAYFDATTAFNSPTNVFRILTLLSFVLYAIHEARRTLNIALPRWYFPFAFLSVLLGTINGVSGIVLYAKGVIALQDGFLGIAVQLSYVLYILSRLLFLAAGKPEKTAANTGAEQSALSAQKL